MESKVTLVTAAAGGGIGESIARLIAANGGDVAVTDIHATRAERVAAEIRSNGGSAAAFALDAGSRTDVDRVVSQVEDSLGSVSILINNAAVNPLGTVRSVSMQEWDRCLAVNLSGPWHLARRVLPGMIEHQDGCIVNISSVAAFLSRSGEGPYAVTKAGLHALTRAIAAENGVHGVRCNAVAPGITWTGFTERRREEFEPEEERTPLGRHATPDDIAEVVAFLVSPAARHITGEIVNVSGGWYMRP
ncbi:MAG: SDR family NAD(P)-dependent oxidoreductase [Solirubrobacterales bacterium]